MGWTITASARCIAGQRRKVLATFHLLRDGGSRLPPMATNRRSDRLAHFLSSSKWMRELPHEDRERVTTSAREVQVAVGDPLFRCGDPSQHWFGLVDGLLVQAVSTE